MPPFITFGGSIAFAGAFLSGSLAVVVLVKGRRAFAYRTLALGMLALALEGLFSGLSFQAVTPEEVLRWQYWRMVATALLPSSWLVFSLGFARENYHEYVTKWKWGVVTALLVPLTLVIGGNFFASHAATLQVGPPGWVWPIHGGGYAFHIFFLLCAVLIMVKLEGTLRASAGGIRWRIKFTLLGVGALFAVRIYTSSQVLLFSTVNLELTTIDAASIVAVDLLVIFSLLRSRFRDVEFYVSQEVLYKSLTVLIVGGYLLAVGVVAAVVRYLGVADKFLRDSFFIFLGILGLAVIMLSDQLRHEIRRFINRHFRRPQYNYRKEWTAFTQRTSTLLGIKDLCMAVVKTVAETVGVSSVSIWLLDEVRKRPVLAGSTSFFFSQEEHLKRVSQEVAFLALTLREQSQVIDLDRSAWSHSKGIKPSNATVPDEGRFRYCVPLAAGSEFLGFMALNERMTKEPLSLEDFDLLKTLADQTAGMILNLKLIDRLGQARELEAFQTVSAFFVHDLKNVASTLSLMLQNLPAHYDNPEFRQDALRIMSASVKKIQDMCGRLSLLKDRIELQQRECDLSELVSNTLAGLNGSLQALLVQDLRPVPKLRLDPEQMQKVLVNLILNAGDALPNGGEIRLSTSQEGDKVAIAVTDNGCGMSREFLEKSLFHPFKTTKDHGSGIGLFQSKMIVEAHRGWIEVESREGQGSTFRVVLPLEQ